jgi:hypothetical protein
MAILLPRSKWTTHGPVRPLASLVPSEVAGIVVHWPGTTGPIGDPGQAKIAARLDSYRSYHVNFKGWADIAYNYAVDQAGRVWILRSAPSRSAANGDEAVNRKYVAVLLLVGPGEHPSAAMLSGFMLARREITRHYPKALAVRGHQDVRPEPTDCPGVIVETLVANGTLLRTPAPRPQAPPVKFVLKRYLALGATGSDVATLQRRVNALRGPDIRVDGDFGPVTRAAVKALQRRKWPLRPSRWDGIVGRLTSEQILGWGFRG